MRGINEVEAIFSNFHSAFEKYKGRLLLLGDSGAGKTTTLMTFARDAVLKRVEDPSSPLPILAPIATWDAEKQYSISEWLAGITSLREEDISQILEKGNALLLFDGLDELGRERTNQETKEHYDPRQRFIQKVPRNNQIVITCRIRDYKEIGTKLAFYGAVTLRSLDDVQVREYLHDLPELWNVLQGDKELREMARVPLILSLFTFAFAGLSKEAQKLHSLNQGELRDTLFETYLKRRYEFEENKRKARLPFAQNLPFTLKQINATLGRIAMEDAGGGGNQNIFSLRNFVRILGKDTARSFVDFMSLLNILTWQNENLRFLHLRIRDFFAFKYAQAALHDDDPEIRDHAAWALWEIPDERAVPLLIGALDDPDEYVRCSAVGALGRIGDRRAIEPLKTLLSDNTPVASIYGNRICEVVAAALDMIQRH
ncbi:MAG TPA: HEAT repeat domain-containing protein [Ktedonobacteraceae bacterium]|nr:HEAT repeat domain-containing protein [Ktedonobacteraceae bacterium]